MVRFVYPDKILEGRFAAFGEDFTFGIAGTHQAIAATHGGGEGQGGVGCQDEDGKGENRDEKVFHAASTFLKLGNWFR